MTITSAAQSLQFVRSVIFLLGYGVATMLCAILIVFSFCVPLIWRYRLLRVYPAVVLGWLKICCGLGYRVIGRENLPTQPSIIFAKHQSTWETLALIACLPPATFVAKRELLWIPFFGWGMAALRLITIDRSAGKKALTQIVSQAKDRMARGLWVVIFPEGTRRVVGAPRQYKMGGAVMAVETAAPVVPIALNSGEFWPRHSITKWRGEITLSIGPAITSIDKTPERVRDEAANWIETEMTAIYSRSVIRDQSGSA